MKKLLLILLCLPMIGFGQISLFTHDLSNSVVATKDPSRTMGLEVNTIVYDNIISEAPESFHLDLPFFNQNISLYLERFEVHSTDLKVMAQTLDGSSELNVIPTILSYKITLNDNSIGVMNFFNGQINATFKVNNQQFEIVDYSNNYILFEASNSINSSNFSCGVESQFNSISTPQNSGASTTQVCIELALEIDFFTRQTFNSDAEAVNWALAILAGVDQLYQAQTNASGSIVSINIWQVTDPYAAYVNDASNMLVALKNYYLTNGSGISRDLVHLMTKRNNTGTGGIAWVDALCDNNWGYGFSSGMNTDTTYAFPNPSYTWNLAVVTHEIGHNIGANHTFWCGWAADASLSFPGGAITNCVNVDGSCPNNPSPGVGTIMSYCHTVSGGSMILEFHDIVLSQALDPGIANASCLTACLVYGCTDQTACNYDPLATIDDGSCIGLLGCMDATACNYDANATCNDGSCEFTSCVGCTDSTAFNYDPLATIDDGSCIYATYVPDDNFEQTLINLGYDNVLDDYVLTSNIDTITMLCLTTGCTGVSGLISDVTGIEDFTALNVFACNQQQLTGTVDLSNNYALTAVYLSNNQLTGININSTYLYSLHISNNDITSLDVSANTALKYLYCSNNLITSLDISNNTALTYLNVGNNQLTSLDVSQNTALETLTCSASSVSSPTNQLTSLDLSQNIALIHLACNNNPISVLDLSNNISLEVLSFPFSYPWQNPPPNPVLTDLNIKNNTLLEGLNLMGQMLLECLEVHDVSWANNMTNLQLETQHYFSLICDTIYGCIDTTACNYDSNANLDDASCILPDGCTDPLACNYDASATCDDGSCLTDYGCMDATACNYDSSATCDDGSCLTAYGCMDATACNYDASATCDDGSCLTVYGCMDATACNYDASATCDDGSCYNLISSISQNGDTLSATTTPVGLNADWYNIQTEDGTTRIWLMEEDASSFTPTFECSYFIVVSNNGCIDTSETYYYGANAARIGSIIHHQILHQV